MAFSVQVGVIIPPNPRIKYAQAQIVNDICMISVLRYEIALWLLDIMGWLLKIIGLGGNTHLQDILYVVLVMAIAIGMSYGMRKLVLFITQRLRIFNDNKWGKHIKRLGILESCTKFIATTVFLGLVSFAFTPEDRTLYSRW